MSKKTKAIRAMGKEQMLERIVELRKQLLKFNSQIAVGTIPESPGKVKQLKKEIARILTIMNEPLKAKASVAPKGAAVKEIKHVGAGKAK
ncbi:MAG: 50S ribosomal protein L29 [Candidatus Nanoarchaeia archaeon]|jgi:large subunit ribosomal protein L29